MAALPFSKYHGLFLQWYWTQLRYVCNSIVQFTLFPSHCCLNAFKWCHRIFSTVKAEYHVHMVEGMARWLTAFVRSLQLRSVNATHMYPGMCRPTCILMGNLPASVYTVIIITVFPQLFPRPWIFSCLDYFPMRWDCTREDLIEDTETPTKIFSGHLQSTRFTVWCLIWCYETPE